MKNCRVCGQPIPPARLEVVPQTVTCSRECSRSNRKVLVRDAVRRHRARRARRLAEPC